MYRSLGVASDKIASAKRNPVQTGNTITSLLTYLLTHLLTYLLIYLLLLLLIKILLLIIKRIIMGDAKVRVKVRGGASR